MEPQITPTTESTPVSTKADVPSKKVRLNLILSILLIISSVFAVFFYFQTQKLSLELKKYQSIDTNPDEESITCLEPRPEICTMECIENPPYICGSDGSSYCSTCQACSNTNIDWYVTRDTPCEEGFPL